MGAPWRETILPLTLQQPEPDTNGPQPRAVPTHRLSDASQGGPHGHRPSDPVCPEGLGQ
jgi:hypothetical protein